MAPGNPFDRNRLYPKAPPPNDVSAVRGNCSDEQKQRNLDTFAYFVGHGGTSVFGYDVVKSLRLVEMNIKRKNMLGLSAGANEEKVEAVEGHTICEIEIREGMLSRHGILAGACLVHILDIATFSAMFALGFVTGVDPTGASNNFDVNWHAAALPGIVLSIHSTTLNSKGRMLSCRAEVYDKKKGTMIASATHTVTPLASFKDTAARKAKL